MSWLTALGSVFDFLASCLRTILHLVLISLNAILSALLVLLAPLIHLTTYLVYAFLMPLHFFSKFETLYIYLGVASLIGLATGSFLHLSSSLLVKLLDLQALPKTGGRTAASVRAAREKRKLEDAWQTSSAIGPGLAKMKLPDTSKEFFDYLDNDRGRRKNGQGLLSQTILEEEDDSEDGY